jgi:hypothetical protein
MNWLVRRIFNIYQIELDVISGDYSPRGEGLSHEQDVGWKVLSEETTKKMWVEDGRWMEVAQYRVQWRALVLAVLNLRVLLPE